MRDSPCQGIHIDIFKYGLADRFESRSPIVCGNVHYLATTVLIPLALILRSLLFGDQSFGVVT
jgi:hypothetical protein